MIMGIAIMMKKIIKFIPLMDRVCDNPQKRNAIGFFSRLDRSFLEAINETEIDEIMQIYIEKIIDDPAENSNIATFNQ